MTYLRMSIKKPGKTMRTISTTEEKEAFYSKLQHDTDGGNFSFIGGNELIHIDCASIKEKTVWFIDIFRLNSTKPHITHLARVDEVGQAWLDHNCEWAETLVLDNEDDAFQEYTRRIVEGAKNYF